MTKIRNLLVGLLLLCYAAFATPPEVCVLVLVDDGDYNHVMQRDGNTDLTPTLSMLKDQGTWFKHGWNTMSVCRTSLATIASGTKPSTNGIRNNSSPGYLDPNICITNIINNDGWTVYMGGKWWEPGPDGNTINVNDYGVDIVECLGTPESGSTCLVRQGQPIALNAINTVPENLFMWWSPMLPHLPWNPSSTLLNAVDLNDIHVPPWIAAEEIFAYEDKEKDFLAMHIWFDNGLNELITALQEKDALVVVINDNGLRNGCVSKQSPYDAGHLVDVVFWRPGVIPAQALDGLFKQEDLMPTILDLMEVSDTFSEIRDGKSQANAVMNGEWVPETAILSINYSRFPTSEHNDPFYEDALGVSYRTNQFHYIRFFQDITALDLLDAVRWKYSFVPIPVKAKHAEELYDIVNDPAERNNLANDPNYAEILRDLRTGALDQYFRNNTEDGYGRDFCPADINRDLLVGLSDLSLLLSEFGTEGNRSDIDLDGFTSLSDLSILLSNFGISCNN